MRNSDKIDYLDLANELDKHLIQVQAVIDYLTLDIGNNKGEFSVSGDCVSGMLWTAQTLIENAKYTADRLHKHNRKAFLEYCDNESEKRAFAPRTAAKMNRIEKQRLATGVNND